MPRPSVLVGLVLLLGAAACERDRRGETVLEAVHHLLVLGNDASEVPIATCTVGDELRLSAGCPFMLPLAGEHGLHAENGPIERRYPVPAGLLGSTLLVEPLYRVSDHDPWRPLPPVFARRVGAEVTVTLPPPPNAREQPFDVTVRATVLPPALQTFATRPVAIGPGAVLTVGLGLETTGLTDGAAPVEFQLKAETDGGTRDVLHAVLDPADPATRQWDDRRIDLGALAGQSVRFVFTARVQPRAGRAADEAYGVPLWGAPLVLEPRPRAGRRNVLLVSLDTLRADHVGVYGADLPTTPEIDRFAAGSTLFEQTIATYPSTPGSHMSMLTGVYPSTHGVIGPLDILPPDIPTLPQLLAARGYETAAFTEDGMLVANAGFARGFDYYRENKGNTIWDASGQVDVTFPAGSRWLEAHRGELFFLFLHTYQVHEPYSPPPAFDLFKTYVENGKTLPITEWTNVAIRDRHKYAGEVRYTDSELARVLAALAALGELDRTVVVITSDHGEEFWEHGWKAHDETLYDEVLRVPLILRAPGLVPSGRRIATQVSLADLTPTLLDLLSIPAPPTMQGRSVVPLFRDPAAPELATRPAFSQLRKRAKQIELLSARTPTRKWIWRTGSGGPPLEVYDLTTDPGEHQNLATPELAAEGEALRARFHALAPARSDQVPSPTPPPTLDPRTHEKLRALGYTD
jgi:arylsulfatase A-like enzyme